MLEASRQDVSLIVVDFRLPGMTGLELIDKIRVNSKNTRFILISGMTDERMEQSVRDLKADRFMPKPLQISEFLEVASELLGISLQHEGPLPVAVKAAPDQGETVNLPDLAWVLTRVRQQLGARVALLANDRGQVVAQAGEMGEADFESSWGPALVAALNSTARLGRLLQSKPATSAQLVRGDASSLVLAPVGEYALLIVLKAESSGQRAAQAIEATLNAQNELSTILERTLTLPPAAPAPVVEPVPVNPPPVEVVEQEPELDEAAIAEMEKTLKGASRSLDRKQADNFWDDISGSEPLQSDNPDVITFDQARQLGLTPEDEDRPEL
jgi:CheY-like chemotaxis protein